MKPPRLEQIFAGLAFAFAFALAAWCVARPAAAQAARPDEPVAFYDAQSPIYEDLEGNVGSQQVSARLELLGRALTGWLNFAADGQRVDLAGQLFARPVSDGLTSCEIAPDAISQKRKHGKGQLVGSCELGQQDGALTLSFEGFWREPGRPDEPVELTSQRTISARLWRRYGAVLPVLAPKPDTVPPMGCAGRSWIIAVARDPSGLAYVLHSRHFECPQPDTELVWSSYSSALSVVDDSGGTLALLSATPIDDALGDANDVVGWAASLSAFWLSGGVLGLAVRAGGTVSGSGAAAVSSVSVFAVVARSAPRLLLLVPGDSFGKTSIDNMGSESVALFSSAPRTGAATFLWVDRSAWLLVDGIEQSPPSTDTLYRFDSKRVALLEVKRAYPLPARLVAIGVAPRMRSEIAAPKVAP